MDARRKLSAQTLYSTARLNGHLEALEQGQQPARLTAVARDTAGNPGAGFVQVTLPATAYRNGGFLIATQPKPNVGVLETQIAHAIGWPLKRFRWWRKKFKRGDKGDAARRLPKRHKIWRKAFRAHTHRRRLWRCSSGTQKYLASDGERSRQTPIVAPRPVPASMTICVREVPREAA